jgi:hypothetical protein
MPSAAEQLMLPQSAVYPGAFCGSVKQIQRLTHHGILANTS